MVNREVCFQAGRYRVNFSKTSVNGDDNRNIKTGGCLIKYCSAKELSALLSCCIKGADV